MRELAHVQQAIVDARVQFLQILDHFSLLLSTVIFVTVHLRIAELVVDMVELLVDLVDALLRVSHALVHFGLFLAQLLAVLFVRSDVVLQLLDSLQVLLALVLHDFDSRLDLELFRLHALHLVADLLEDALIRVQVVQVLCT